GRYLRNPFTTPRTAYDLTVYGVTIYSPDNKEVLEWFAHHPETNSPLLLGLPAHELGHLLTSIPDLYSTGWQFDAGIFSRMGAGCSACQITHHDPFFKLRQGWLNYTVALGSRHHT